MKVWHYGVSRPLALNISMKRSIFFALALLVSSQSASAQFRSELPRLKDEQTARNTLGAMSGEGGIMSKLLDPNNWSMRQNYSFSYSTNGTNSVGISAFTNTFLFRPSDDMIFSADVSAVYSPFSTFGDKFSKSINGIYLSSARFDWKLGESTYLMVSYDGGPLNTLNSFGRYNAFDRFAPFTDTKKSVLGFQADSQGWRTTRASITQ